MGLDLCIWLVFRAFLVQTQLLQPGTMSFPHLLASIVGLLPAFLCWLMPLFMTVFATGFRKLQQTDKHTVYKRTHLFCFLVLWCLRQTWQRRSYTDRRWLDQTRGNVGWKYQLMLLSWYFRNRRYFLIFILLPPILHAVDSSHRSKRLCCWSLLSWTNH